MTMRNEKFEELLSEELARQLEPQRGKAAAAFQAQLAAEETQRAAERERERNVAGGSKNKENWARHEVTPRTLWLWMGVPSLVAACLAVVVTLQFTRDPDNGINSTIANPGTNPSAIVASQTDVTHNKPGAVVVRDNQPMREIHQEHIRTVEWIDPTDHATYTIVEQPAERVITVPAPSIEFRSIQVPGAEAQAMKRALPITALITGLMGMPAAWPMPAQAAIQIPVVTAFPAQMPATVADQMRRVARGETLDAFGMRGVRRQLALAMERRLAGLAETRRPEKWLNVQLTQPKKWDLDLIVPATVPTEKATFLGVVATPVEARLRAQLKLPKGVGLIVDYVDLGSPAEKAGLRNGDILKTLDDQLLVNGEQMAVLVRNHKPGDTVKMSIMREGDEKILNATLAEKEMPLPENAAPPLGMPGAGPAIRERVFGAQMNPEELGKTWLGATMNIDEKGTVRRRLVDEQNDISIIRTADGKENLTVKDRAGRELFAGPPENLAPAKLPQDLITKIDILRASPARIQIGNNPADAVGNAGIPETRPGASGITTTRTFTINRKDAQHDILLKSVDGDRHLTIKEIPAGNILFDGPANTPDDLKNLPPTLQPKVQALLDKVK